MARKKSKLDLAWTEKPEWKAKVHKVNTLKTAGFSEELIAAVSDVPGMEVRRIVEEEQATKALAKENYKNKLPMMKDIIGMGLDTLIKTMRELVSDDVRRQYVLSNVGEMVQMKNLVKDLEMLVRLEEGKSTENIAVGHSFQKTREAIIELKKVDPVFDYPDLPPALPEPNNDG